MTILVVDDEPEYRLVLKNVLVSEGYTVLVAENGEDGFTKLSQNPVDLVISDIYMPVLDGIRFHRKVRSTPEFTNVPFLFVSAFDDQHTLDAVQNPRTEGFLRKARPVSELKEWIQYLTTPEEKRSKMPPGGARSRLNDQLRRSR
ncbi:MAG: response regulator [Ignavibacteriae bacterium]|nr:response regulator [Ignavibacteriota bacterium]